jgi:hypothetical protein
MDRSISPLIVSKTAAQWTAEDPYLARGDYGVESDTGKEKVGVGSRWTVTGYKPDDSGLNPGVVALTYASTVTTDASQGSIFDLTLTGNVTLANPTNPVDGKTIRWRIRQDGTGSRTVTLGNKFVIPSSATSPLPFSTAANKMDILAATYHAGRDKWDIVAFVPGY